MVHFFTKLGAGEYYLEELEETICYLELKRKMLLERTHGKTKDDPDGMGSHEFDDVDGDDLDNLGEFWNDDDDEVLTSLRSC